MPQALDELMTSIAKMGVVQPIVFRQAERLTIDESSYINEAINNNMKRYKIEFKKNEFESKAAAEKIVLMVGEVRTLGNS